MRNKNRFARRAFAALLSFALILPGCGGGGGGGGGSSLPRQPALIPAQALNAPVIHRRDGVQIGGDVRPSRNSLSPAGTHGGAAISTGRVRDGESVGRVAEYLDIQKFELSEPLGEFQRISPAKQVVLIRETTDDRYIDLVVRAVQLINTALPYDRRITVSPERAWHPPEFNEDSSYIPRGHIYVGIAPQDEWPFSENVEDRAAGLYLGVSASDGDGLGSIVWLNNEILPDDGAVIKVLAHEMYHALGFSAHIESAQMRSILNAARSDYSGILPYILHQIDRDALYALYARIDDGSVYVEYDPNDLGPWTDVSFHLRGDMDDVSFGASSRNGLIQPWAHGSDPSTNLSGMGSASWTGRLLGFTSESESLAGATNLTINLSTLRGQIDFTGLEHWGVNATPGAIGSGQIWNDGDLRYSVIVRGNTFRQTGGDAGEVTGAFFGAQHEAMGGVVERSDMSAGFGGTR